MSFLTLSIVVSALAIAATCWFAIPLALRATVMKPAKCKSKRRLDGKVVLVTGANTGLGKVTAADLSARGALVYMACRNMEKAESAKEEILKQNPEAKLKLLKMDLGSLKSVKECAEAFLREEECLDILVANAGFGKSQHTLTEDNIESHLGCNHLGHFYLTRLLISSLENAGKPSDKSRIVVLSSIAHLYTSSVQYEELANGTAKNAYGQSKLANMLFVHYLNNLLTDGNVTVNGLHPGIVKTEFTRYFFPYPRLVPLVLILLFPLTHFIKTALEGTQTQIWASVEESLEGVSGKYFQDCDFSTPSKAAQNDEEAENLWRWSCSKTGLPLDL